MGELEIKVTPIILSKGRIHYSFSQNKEGSKEIKGLCVQ